MTFSILELVGNGKVDFVSPGLLPHSPQLIWGICFLYTQRIIFADTAFRCFFFSLKKNGEFKTSSALFKKRCFPMENDLTP